LFFTASLFFAPFFFGALTGDFYSFLFFGLATESFSAPFASSAAQASFSSLKAAISYYIANSFCTF